MYHSRFWWINLKNNIFKCHGRQDVSALILRGNFEKLRLLMVTIKIWTLYSHIQYICYVDNCSFWYYPSISDSCWHMTLDSKVQYLYCTSIEDLVPIYLSSNYCHLVHISRNCRSTILSKSNSISNSNSKSNIQYCICFVSFYLDVYRHVLESAGVPWGTFLRTGEQLLQQS